MALGKLAEYCQRTMTEDTLTFTTDRGAEATLIHRDNNDYAVLQLSGLSVPVERIETDSVTRSVQMWVGDEEAGEPHMDLYLAHDEDKQKIPKWFRNRTRRSLTQEVTEEEQNSLLADILNMTEEEIKSL